MSNLSDPRTRRLVAGLLGAFAIAVIRARVAPELKIHPVVGALVGLVLGEVVQPAITSDLIRRGI